MSTTSNSLKAIKALVAADQALQSRLAEATDLGSLAEILGGAAIASGMDITVAAIASHLASALSDAELDKAAGGMVVTIEQTIDLGAPLGAAGSIADELAQGQGAAGTRILARRYRGNGSPMEGLSLGTEQSSSFNANLLFALFDVGVR